VKPVIALVGRPNVGKSTLFNRITKSRDAIVADFSGLTRDRHYGDARLGNREFIVVDTGGFEPDSTTGIVKEMARQTRQAVAEADAVIFVVDLRAGVVGTGPRHCTLPAQLQQEGRAGGQQGRRHAESPLLAEFHELGIGAPHPVSAAHGQGIRSLLEAALENFPEPEDEDVVERSLTRDPPGGGRPAQRRQVDADQRLAGRRAPGGLRPARHHARCDPRAVRTRRAPLRADRHRRAAPQGQGLRGHREVLGHQDLQAIADANVVLLLIDATQGVSDQDAHIAGYILDSGRAVVVAINKWDATDDYQRETLARSIETGWPS
jgi:GTP-binding protein